MAILGFGTVGRSVAEILSYSPHPRLKLTHVFNRGVDRKKVSWADSEVLWTDNIDDVLASDVDIVVEAVGGLHPAEDWVRKALSHGKSVVTANKQLIAHRGAELARLAADHGQKLEFGASVAGGIPVLLGLQEGLAGDRLFRISGILNGTCNYILSRMESAGVSFEAALAEAQQLGYAEADPTDDIEGYDARAKLAILVRVAMRARVLPDEVRTESVARVQAVDFAYAADLGCTIRQVSRAEIDGRSLFASVEPALVPRDSALARAEGSQNVIVASGKYGGNTVFAGHGAGGHPTAVAVVSDLIAVASDRATAFSDALHGHYSALQVNGNFTAPHYVRFVVKDRPGIIARIAESFSRVGINIDAVQQRPGFPKSQLPFAVTIEPCGTSILREALHQVQEADFHVEPPVSFPILK